ncbi:MAG TPA: hypothetical protein VMD05_06510 [Candidatus Nanoarchaeia archaeon]|nr:hypothetical protein [Candidatus Nanoarchaeia archaeon]
MNKANLCVKNSCDELRLTRRSFFTLAIIFLAICTVLPVLSANASSQAPKLEWEHFFSGFVGYTVLQTSDGGFMISGVNFSSTILIKTDSGGNLLWTRSYELGGTNTSLPYLIQTKNGGYALGGTINNEYVVVKVDSVGIIEWHKSFFLDEPYNSFRGFVQTSDGGYAFVGTFSPPQNATHAVGQIWFVKIDSSGNMQWNKTIVGPQGDFANSIVQNSDGGYAIFCTSWESETLPSAFKIIKTDSNGNELWNKTYGGSGSFFTAESDAGIETRDGGYLLAGVSVDKGTDYLAWLVKTDYEGNMLWNQNYGGFGSWALAVTQSSDGGYCFAGLYNGKGVWLVKTDSVGAVEWNETFSGASIWGVSVEDFGKPLIQARNGGYVLVGSLDSQIWVAQLASSNASITGFSFYLVVAAAVVLIIVIVVVVATILRRRTCVRATLA